MATRNIVEKNAGQSQRLTSLLHDLVRRYPKTIGIFNEFIQNADDARASVIDFILDGRSYPHDLLPAPQMASLMGPALLVYNDSVFSDEDFDNIQKIGDSGKLMEFTKTGRFGFGFNASYNITDYPSFLSRQWVYFFDPHQDAMPDQSPGKAYQLTPDLWETYPDMLRPFEAAGLLRGTTDFPGTIFRLPLRTDARSKLSQIKSEPFTSGDFETLVGRFSEGAGAALIFLKHVLRVAVHQVGNLGNERTRILNIETENAAEVAAARESLTRPLSEPAASLLNKLAAAAPTCVFEHQVCVHRHDKPLHYKWQVASGYYFDKGGTVLAAARKMVEAREKAIPFVGVAAQLAEDSGEFSPQKVVGQAYCFLPLPIATGLPVHINGFFDLGSDRRTLTQDPNSLGRDELRVKWNELLCEKSIPMAYRDLIIALVGRQGDRADPYLYDVFPDARSSTEMPLKLLGLNVYKSIQADAVIRCATKRGAPWAEIGSIWLPPPDRPQIQEALVADAFTIPDPPLPPHVQIGFEAAGAKLDLLSPEDLRVQLRVETNLVTRIEDAPRACLRRREWIEELLRYCLSDANAAEKIAGLPLALLADAKLHTFGPLAGGHVFLADEAERSICKSKPAWFIDADFAAHCQVPVSSAGHVARMTPANLAVNLPQILDPDANGCPTEWTPDGDAIPNGAWLSELFRYLTCHQAAVVDRMRAWKVQPPLLPDQNGQLCPANLPSSPLLVPPELASNRALMDAIDTIGISRILAPTELQDVISQFAHATGGNVVRFLTGPNLVAAMKDQEPGWRSAITEYRADIHDPLLDFLSSDLWNYSQDTARALRSLPIFPTEDGQLVCLSDGQVFVTPDEPPQVPCNVKLLKLGKQRRWRSWLRRLEVPALDHATLIRDVLLPRFSECDEHQQYELLRWIRDHLRQTVRHLEGVNPDSAIALRTLVAGEPLFRCADGILRNARNVYDPNQRVIQDILGDDASVVDIETYRTEWDEWLSILQYLGMPQTPLPEDLLGCIDQLIRRAAVESISAVSEKIDRLFRHVAEHWEMLANATVCDPHADHARRPLSEALADRAWLLAETDKRRMGRYAGFAAPETRLYRAAELFPIRLAHLCASQRPISAHPRVPANFMRAIGMPTSVTEDVVMAHFEQLLTLWDSEEHGGIAVEVLQATLKKLYSHFGGATDADESDGDEIGADLPAADIDTSGNLKERFGARACLWHPETQQFWRPERTFRTKCPFLSPYYASLKMSDADVDRGYEALGRTDEPGTEDFVAFLREASDEYPDLLPLTRVKQVLEVESRLAHTVAAADQSLRPTLISGDIPLLTTERRFVPADAAYYCDAEWHLNRLGSGQVHVLHHPGTDYAVAQYLNVECLSVGIKERLLTVEGDPTNTQVITSCKQWQETLRSHQFKSGILRLLRCNPVAVVAGFELDWLDSVEVRPFKLIRTELLVDRGAGLTPVGESECDDFVHHDDESGRTIIYLSESADVQLEFFLARSIIRQLKPLQLDRQPELQQILNSSPENIESLLTRLHVPRVEEHAETPSQEDDEGFVIPSEDDDKSVIPSTVEQSAGGADASEQKPDPNTSEDTASQTEDQDSATDDTFGDADFDVDSSGADEDESDRSDPAAKKDGAGRNPLSPTSQSPTGFGNGAAGSIGSAPHGTGRRHSDGPPTQDTHGRSSGTSGARRQRGRALTYVVPEGAETTKQRDAGDDEQLANMKIGQAAVDHVLRFERVTLRRNAKPMAHNNAGYDVISTSQDGLDVRYIEVKGIDGPWPEDGVPLSKKQFEMAQEFREAYWLYVVENARSENAKVYPIQNPAQRVTQFRFDPGWRDMALRQPSRASISATKVPATSKSATPVKRTHLDVRVAKPASAGDNGTPRIGSLIRWSDGREGKITNAQHHGRLCHLHVKLHVGDVVHGPFDPSRMTLL